MTCLAFLVGVTQNPQREQFVETYNEIRSDESSWDEMVGLWILLCVLNVIICWVVTKFTANKELMDSQSICDQVTLFYQIYHWCYKKWKGSKFSYSLHALLKFLKIYSTADYLMNKKICLALLWHRSIHRGKMSISKYKRRGHFNKKKRKLKAVLSMGGSKPVW